jgi:PPM family protein phosphatase
VQKTKSATTWKAWGDTDPGKQRQNNEDRIVCDSHRGFFVVADGMGGEAAGEVAAQQAVASITKRLSEETGTAERRLREAITTANNDICRLAGRNPQWNGMACVLTAALIEEATLHIGHVGDSRLYRIQKGAIAKITRDHSPVGQKEDSGELTELEAMRHPRRNEVFRDVGSQPHKPDDPDFIEYLQIPFDRDAAFLLCSDGLSDMLTSKEIAGSVIENAGNPREAVRRLIEKANATGGKDNISVVVIEAEQFAASADKAGTNKQAAASSPSGFRGRWAFLLYGLIAGLVVSYLWLRPARPETGMPEQQSLSVQMPAVRRVAPGSLEYPTISRALDAAHAGDRIVVEDGEYEELIRLKEGVEISARSPGKAILYITRALPGADAAIIADGIKRAVVSGLVIKAEPAAGLPFGVRISSSSVNVQNLEISGARQAGILVDGESGSVLTAVYVHGNMGPGILTAGSANPMIIGSLVYANGISRASPSPGLYVMGNSNPDAKRNVFSGNGSGAIRLQRQELKDRMMDNLFINSGKPGRAVTVENVRP